MEIILHYYHHNDTYGRLDVETLLLYRSEFVLADRNRQSHLNVDYVLTTKTNMEPYLDRHIGR